MKYDDAAFNEGVNHTVELLARVLGVTDYVPGDGSEDYDEDLGQTMRNILEVAALYDSETATFTRRVCKPDQLKG